MDEGKRGDTASLSSLQSRSEAREALHSLLQLLKNQYNITLQEVVEEFHNNSDDVPLSIFSTPLSPAEALVKYLKEERSIGFHRIGVLLNRDERGLWSSYARSKQKHASKFLLPPLGFQIPLYLFANRSLSILENVLFYLHTTLNLPEKELSKLLNKRQAVIHTTLQRARKKRGQL
ncbi:hypothetical protein HYS47_05420 [Candidatus Woesearchaeota archaeon]|nr:hypothetical protein [Candidatus Woesearchaeota archaeon]